MAAKLSVQVYKIVPKIIRK